MRRNIAIVSCVIILALINLSIYHKEQQLAQGQIVFLELAPKDPRSIMQGDYMTLRFSITREIEKALKNTEVPKRDNIDGLAVVSLNKQNVGHFQRIHQPGETLAESEQLIQFKRRKRNIKLSTDAYFFQEGDAKIYDKAKYGQFRAKPNGVILLAHVADKNLVLLSPSMTKPAHIE